MKIRQDFCFTHFEPATVLFKPSIHLHRNFPTSFPQMYCQRIGRSYCQVILRRRVTCIYSLQATMRIQPLLKMIHALMRPLLSDFIKAIKRLGSRTLFCAASQWVLEYSEIQSPIRFYFFALYPHWSTLLLRLPYAPGVTTCIKFRRIKRFTVLIILLLRT